MAMREDDAQVLREILAIAPPDSRSVSARCVKLSALLAALALGLAPISGLAAQVLHRQLEAEPETLDPPKSTSVYDAAVEADLFEGLVILGSGETILPGAAESWELAPDGVTYTFHLRKDARWSNGEPLTAQDFVYAWRRVVDPATAAGDLDPVGELVNAREINSGKITDLTKLGVEAVDDHTLRAVTATPVQTFVKQCSYRFAYPVHQVTLERWGSAWTKPGHIVSNGPFVMKSWVPQSAIVLTRNPTYWNASAIKLDEVDHVVVTTDATSLKLFRAGELDFIRAPTKEVPGLLSSHDPALRTGRDNNMSYLFFNMKQGVLAEDHRLRETLALVFDPTVITDKVMRRGQQPAYSWVPPTVLDYTRQEPSYVQMSMPKRIDRARELYAEAGYGPDHPLHLTVNYGTFEDTKTLLLVAAQMWKQALGVEVQLENEEFQIFLERARRGDFQLGALAWRGGLRDADSFLQIWESDKVNFNDAHYANPKVDALLKAASATFDPGERRELYQRTERLIIDDVPGIPIEFRAVNALVNPRLEGWDSDILMPESRFLSFRD
jgi:oligopeptide transport system substrate-binding protein